MTGIVHERVVASRDKGLATDWNADHEITGDVDMDQHSWKNQVIENLNAFPGGPVEGQIIRRSDLNLTYVFNGTDWIPLEPAIPHGTYYWTCPASNFTAHLPESQIVEYYDGFLGADADRIAFFAPVFLPDGATVTAVIVYGNAAASAESWFLHRVTLTTAVSDAMAWAKINTKNVTILSATINNNLYAYTFRTASLDTGDKIHGARITYTL